MQAKSKIALLTVCQNCVTKGAFLRGGTMPPLVTMNDFKTWNCLRSDQTHLHWQSQRQNCKFWEETTPRVHITDSPFPGIWTLACLNFAWKIFTSFYGYQILTSTINRRVGQWFDSKAVPLKAAGRFQQPLEERPGETAHTATAAPMTAVAMLSHRCLTYRAIFKIHCFWQEINSNGRLKRRKALVTATCLPASANQIFLYKLSEMFTNL